MDTNNYTHNQNLKFFSVNKDSLNFKKEGQITGKFVVAVGPQYFRAAKSYALAAFSSLSYPPRLKCTTVLSHYLTSTLYTLYTLILSQTLSIVFYEGTVQFSMRRLSMVFYERNTPDRMMMMFNFNTLESSKKIYTIKLVYSPKQTVIASRPPKVPRMMSKRRKANVKN